MVGKIRLQHCSADAQGRQATFLVPHSHILRNTLNDTMCKTVVVVIASDVLDALQGSCTDLYRDPILTVVTVILKNLQSLG